MAFLVVCTLQVPGRLVGDTKADLVIDPLAFMGRALQMWDASGFAGQVQNQAYGYLFPMGPFFALFDLAGTPGWITQRLWWALLLSLAFLGANKLFERLEMGTQWSRYVGALAYSLSPRIVALLGAASVEAYPAALAPWVLVPLVSMAAGRGALRAAALSALGVAAMGGVNAAVNLAAVLPAVLWFATRKWDRTVARLAAWWTVFVVMATAWWVVPLLLLGRYSPNFLDYIEDASTTTSTTNLIEVLRGTSHWVGFFANGVGSTWQIGGDLVTNSAFVANTVVVAAAGLIGIMVVKTTERLWIVTCLLVGISMVTFGHEAAVDGWFAESQRTWLDGALSPLRNVHKFDVLIRLALSLGIVLLLGRVDIRRAWARGGFAVAIGSVTVAFAVISVAAPAFIGRLAPTGSFIDVPGYWQETGTWLDDNPNGRALLAPGAQFGRYLWGSPNDEILQTQTTSEWEVRNAIPLTSPGHIRMLDAVERRFQSGQPSDGLADFLSRNGIGYVVVRHDLSGSEAHARTGFVEQVLSRSPGFELVKTFGPDVGQPSLGSTLFDANLSSTRKAVEIWKVGSTTPDRVTLTASSNTPLVSGDSQSLLDLTDGGLLPAGATVLEGDLDGTKWRPSGQTILTDSYRRREVDFGRIGNNQSSTMTVQDKLTIGRKVYDYAPFSVLEHGALGEWLGAENVTASSSVSDARSEFRIRPEGSVRAMFDEDPESAWSARTLTAGTPQSVRVTPESGVSIGRIIIQMAPNAGSEISAITAVADKGDPVQARVDATDGDRWIVYVDSSVSDRLTIRFKPVAGALAPVRVADLDIEGMHVGYRIRLPDDLVSGPDLIVASATSGYNDGCVSVENTSTRCSPTIERAGEDDTGMVRAFSVDTPGVFQVTGHVAMRPGSRMNELYKDAMDPEITASVSSNQIDLPEANAFALLDGEKGTTWIAAAADEDPKIAVTLDRRRTISDLKFRYNDAVAASRPGNVTVHIDGKEFHRTVKSDGVFNIPPTKADSFELVFTGDERTASFDPTTARTQFISIGISELEIRGVPENLPGKSLNLLSECGDGPTVRIDGKTYETSVSGSSDVLLSGQAATTSACGEDIRLGRGVHQIMFESTPTWRPIQFAMALDGHIGDEPGTQQLAPKKWTARERMVTVPERRESSYLAISENVNSGWQARLDGERLSAVTIDGWKQGFVVPAGIAGVISLEFQPSTTYTSALGFGLVLFMALMFVGAVFMRGEAEPRSVVRAASASAVQSVILVVGLGLIGGTVGAGVGVLAVALGLVARRNVSRSAFLFGLGILSVSIALGGVMLTLGPAGSDGYVGNKPTSQILVLTALAMATAPWHRGEPSGGGVLTADQGPDREARKRERSRPLSARTRM